MANFPNIDEPERNEAREEAAAVYHDLRDQGLDHAAAMIGLRGYFKHMAERNRDDLEF